MVEVNNAENNGTGKQGTVRYCYIIRHGERGDKSPDEEIRAQNEGVPDPILTETGHKQA